MLCSRCKKRPAVIFIAKQEGENTTNEGLCLTCAKELGIKPVNDLLDKFGISDDELAAMSDQMMSLMGDMGGEDGDFEMGGSVPMPFFNMFGGGEAPQGNDNAAKDKKSGKKEKQDDGKKFLNQYCENLTEKARSGKMDNIIGRDSEIYRVIQILCRRTKNNPCLIGEPGVGKTAIAEGIAQRIAAGNVPYKLHNKEVYLLDMTALVAGTQFRGQFESRIKGLIAEVKKQGNIILFIDEVHTLVGTGDAEGSMNAAQILKPALSRGEIQVIGATTFNEYRKHIEKDAALERRFQPVKVEEPNIEDTVAMLKGIKKYYENYHKVSISDNLLVSAVHMSERYITDRFLPDKAIDLIDEACACAALESKVLSEYQQLDMKMAGIRAQLAVLESDEQPDYQKLAELRAEEYKVRDRLVQIEPEATSVQVTEEDLATVIELWTGIPASKIKETELAKVAGLKEIIRKRLVGQDEAVDQLVKAIARHRVQLNPKKRPASFIFVGPTGVGKTELVKVMSETLFDSVEPLIRLDMSEYMEKHSVSKIIGSPPGYVGYDEAGQLTEKVRRKPYSVILLDEIEKAHPDVLNIMLQILDEGSITDAHGRKVSFEKTIIVMTSNAGSNLNSNAMGFTQTKQQASRDHAMKALSEFLRPEFLGRIDEVIVFAPLTEEEFAQIADMQLKQLSEALFMRGITLQYDSGVTACIGRQAYSQKSGARAVARVIRRQVEDPVSELIVHNYTNPADHVKLMVSGEEIVVEAL